MTGAGRSPRRGPRGGLLTGLGWLALALAIVALLAHLGGVGLADMARRIARAPLWAFGAAALAQAAIIVMAAHRWAAILASLSPGAPGLGLRDSTAATTLAVLAGQVLPIQVITPLVRAWFAARRGVPALRAAGSSVFEQAFEVLVLVSMAIMAGLIGAFADSPALAGAAALTIIAALVLAIRPVLRLAARGCAGLGGRLAGLGAGLAALGGWSDGLLIWLSGLSFARYGLMAALNVGLLSFLAPDVGVTVLVLAFPLVLLVMSLPIFPGGLGVVELTWSGTLIAAGMAPGAAVEAALSLRVISTAAFFAAAPFLVALMTPRAPMAEGAA